jgi:hypothetical protein
MRPLRQPPNVATRKTFFPSRRDFPVILFRSRNNHDFRHGGAALSQENTSQQIAILPAWHAFSLAISTVVVMNSSAQSRLCAPTIPSKTESRWISQDAVLWIFSEFSVTLRLHALALGALFVLANVWPKTSNVLDRGPIRR